MLVAFASLIYYCLRLCLCFYSLLFLNLKRQGETDSTYMRSMVVETQIMIYDGVVDVVCPYQMLERTRTLLRRLFDFVNLYRWDVQTLGRRSAAYPWYARQGEAERSE